MKWNRLLTQFRAAWRRLAVVVAVAGAWPAVFSTRAAAAPSPSPRPDPITVDPSWSGVPWEGKVQTLLNVTAQVALACCVAAFLIGAAALGLGRATGSYQGGSSGLQMILRGGAGALVVASAASFVSWLIG